MVERVVVAPDKFKGSLSAADVTARVAEGLALGGFAGEVVPVPVADGGDGTVAAAVAAGYRRVDVEVPARSAPPSSPRSRSWTGSRSSRRRRRAG